MRGTLIDCLVIVVAGLLGLLLRRSFVGRSSKSKEIEQVVCIALGLTAIPIGVSLFLKTANPLVILLSITLGYLWGYLWKLHDHLNGVGDYLKRYSKYLDKFFPSREGESFTNAFVVASVVSLVGPLAVMGPLEAGLNGNLNLLYTKCVFDGFATAVFALGMGTGVVFSFIPVLIFQGAITLASSFVGPLLTEAVVAEMTAAGGVMIMAMGISVAGIKELKMGDFLPAILLAPILYSLWCVLF